MRCLATGAAVVGGKVPLSESGPTTATALISLARDTFFFLPQLPVFMLTRLARPARHLLRTQSRLLHASPIMATSSTAAVKPADRMTEGGTQKLDVWSIFT